MLTTLNFEIERIKMIFRNKFEPPRSKDNRTIEEKIFSIFLNSANHQLKLPAKVLEAKQAIEWSVSRNLPINVSIYWALSGHARNHFKIHDWDKNLPRLGYIWGLLYFDFLHQKVQRIYEPGLNINLLDEPPMLQVLGWSKDELNSRRNLMLNLTPSSIKIREMPDPAVDNVDLTDIPTNSQVLSMLTAMENPNLDLIKSLAEKLYVPGSPDWEKIIMDAGESWGDAVLLSQRINSVKNKVTEMGWLKNEVFPDQPFIHGSLLTRGGWTPNIWGNAAPAHGAALLDTNNMERYSTTIIPEFKMKELKKTPVYITVGDFKSLGDVQICGDQRFVFYWK